ncbi:MAG: hypothetical protein ACI3WQ_06325 [Faecousia sp.]
MNKLKQFFENSMDEYARYYMGSQPYYWWRATRFETAADTQREHNESV